MASLMTLRVTHDDGRIEVADVYPVDLADFEDHFDVSSAQLSTNTRMTHLLWLAWTSLRRADKNTPEDQRAWALDVISIEPAGEEDEPIPLDPALSPDSSPS